MTPLPNLGPLRGALDELIEAARNQEARLAGDVERVHPSHRPSARNLAHYLALRQHDLRDLQPRLAALGLSSLGRSEGCVLATLNAVAQNLAFLAGDERDTLPSSTPPTSIETAERELSERATALLGPSDGGRAARIMLTLPPDAEASRIEALLAGGADAVRINCAKGDPESWGAMIERVRLAAERRGRPCPVLCDLAGPNPRTADPAGDPPRDTLGRIGAGHRLLLTRGHPHGGEFAARGDLVVACTLPSVLDDLVTGERVFYDDGKLSGVVREVTNDGVRVEIVFARKDRVKVRPDKGLNFPDSKLSLPPLTEKDLSDLRFVARHADMVGMSFVRSPEDVTALQDELARLDARHLGLVLKIETVQAFQALPRLLLAAMRSERVGIMVARGDMAIELGFERLAEAQEEVLWLSEAAGVPVIWATQVLDVLNRTGVPSRAEVTDAAMSGRAECVMLNQGKHQLEALHFLRNVLLRMDAHQRKKRPMLRRLNISNLG